MSAPSAAVLRSLRHALWLEEHSAQREPWVTHRSWIVEAACLRRGLAEPYRITPGGRAYYRITEAGRALIKELSAA